MPGTYRVQSCNELRLPELASWLANVAARDCAAKCASSCCRRTRDSRCRCVWVGVQRQTTSGRLGDESSCWAKTGLPVSCDHGERWFAVVSGLMYWWELATMQSTVQSDSGSKRQQQQDGCTCIFDILVWWWHVVHLWTLYSPFLTKLKQKSVFLFAYLSFTVQTLKFLCSASSFETSHGLECATLYKCDVKTWINLRPHVSSC